MRFALIGKVDINRDGKDDRDKLTRLIQQMGGVVDFDLPPPGAGEETGKLLPRIDWYVIDGRTASPVGLDAASNLSPASLRQEVQFQKRISDTIKEARLNGTRPMPIERLLSFLDCDVTPPAVARSDRR